jgi:hypothetical protein
MNLTKREHLYYFHDFDSNPRKFDLDGVVYEELIKYIVASRAESELKMQKSNPL